MKLIDKDALVAVLKKRQREHDEKKYDYASSDHFWASVEDGKILSFLNTLEVKEVDLDKEYKDFVEEDPVYNKLVNSIVGKAIAKHFFELGLKAQKGE